MQGSNTGDRQACFQLSIILGSRYHTINYLTPSLFLDFNCGGTFTNKVLRIEIPYHGCGVQISKLRGLGYETNRQPRRHLQLLKHHLLQPRKSFKAHFGARPAYPLHCQPEPDPCQGTALRPARPLPLSILLVQTYDSERRFYSDGY